MFVLVTGGSGSGKSAYAERLIATQKTKEPYYIATMIPSSNQETKEKIDRHRKMREKVGFITKEWYTNLENIEIPQNSAVLLECMSNLVANEMYSLKGAKERTKEEVINGIKELEKKTKYLCIVTNEVFSDGISYDKDTAKYMQTLGNINKEMAEMADKVIEVVYDIPIILKEEKSLEENME
jgi:Adenosyl cobinamide kinase/adenosyl cobinamide phosphate guanylyltransferase